MAKQFLLNPITIRASKLKYGSSGEYKNITIRNNLREDFKKNGSILFNQAIPFPNGSNYIAIPPMYFFTDLLSIINNINQKLGSAGVTDQVEISAFPNGYQGKGMLQINFWNYECEECAKVDYITPTLIDPKTKLYKDLDGYWPELLIKWATVNQLVPEIIIDGKAKDIEELKGDFRTGCCPHKNPEYYKLNGEYVDVKPENK